MAGRCPVTALRDLVGEYLALRRALGYTLHREGWLLPRFVTFLESRGYRPHRVGSRGLIPIDARELEDSLASENLIWQP